MSRFGLVNWLDQKLEDAERWVRAKDKEHKYKIQHRSPCLHCDEMVLGSISEGFYHAKSGQELCDLGWARPNTNIKATPRSLFPNHKKDNK